MCLTFVLTILYCCKQRTQFVSVAFIFAIGGDSEPDPTASEAEVERAKKSTLRAMQAHRSRHEKVLEGERAILNEIDLEKKRQKTSRVDMLGQNYMQMGSITSDKPGDKKGKGAGGK